MCLAATGLWWAGVLVGDGAGRAAHGPLMTFGFFPLYFLGFLFTAGPKWLGLPPLPSQPLRLPVALHLTGWAVYLVAGDLQRPLQGAGMSMAACGASIVLVRFVRMVQGARDADRTHPWLIAGAMAIGAACLWGAAAGTAVDDAALVRACTRAALWAFVGLVFTTALHRLVPFLSAAAVPALDARHPRWLLWCLTAAMGFEAVADVAEAMNGFAGPVGWGLRAGVECVAGLAAAALAVRWAAVQGLRLRMPVMLQLGWAWFAVAFLLLAATHALRAAGHEAPGLARAGLHGYTMGFLGSTMFAMVSRVSATQQGRTVGIDGLAWGLFWALQIAVVARVAHATAAEHAGSAPMLAGAALVWAVVMTTWVARQTWWFGLPTATYRPPLRAGVAGASHDRDPPGGR